MTEETKPFACDEQDEATVKAWQLQMILGVAIQQLGGTLRVTQAEIDSLKGLAVGQGFSPDGSLVFCLDKPGSDDALETQALAGGLQ
jgi:hypothetical protein